MSTSKYVGVLVAVVLTLCGMTSAHADLGLSTEHGSPDDTVSVKLSAHGSLIFPGVSENS